MTKRNDRDHKKSTFNGPPGSHQVGYGRPPVAAQFVQGQSGNPAGRPLGSKNKPVQLGAYELRNIILSEANRKIEIREGNEVVTVPMVQAVVRKIAIDALKGQPRAQETYMKYTTQAEREEIAFMERNLEMNCAYKSSCEQELHRRARAGITHLPDPLPHPDDMFINFQAGEVEYHGPMTLKEEEEWENYRKTLIKLQEGLPSLEAMLKGVRASSRRKLLEELIGKVHSKITEIEEVLPASYIARKSKSDAELEKAKAKAEAEAEARKAEAEEVSNWRNTQWQSDAIKAQAELDKMNSGSASHE